MALDEKWSDHQSYMSVETFLTIYSAVKEIVILKLHSHLMVALEENLDDHANKQASSSEDNKCL